MSLPPESRRAGAILTVDLDAVAANWRLLRDLGRARGKPVECAAVLKADAYGLGAEQVGRRLWAEGCRYFFVAHIDEGIALRAAVPEAWICVLNGLLPGTDADRVLAVFRKSVNHEELLRMTRPEGIPDQPDPPPPLLAFRRPPSASPCATAAAP